jgi:hypothetical protein
MQPSHPNTTTSRSCSCGLVVLRAALLCGYGRGCVVMWVVGGWVGRVCGYTELGGGGGMEVEGGVVVSLLCCLLSISCLLSLASRLTL